MSKQSHQINEEIRDQEVRLVAEDGAQLGIVSIQEALASAHDRGLDLVMIAPKANPPVCKTMDYGKFMFEQAKRDKEARRKQHIVEVKEVRMTPGIDTHDFEVKQRSAARFLRDGNKVKASVRFKGRAITHPSIGEQLLLRFSKGLDDIADVEKAPKLEGRNMSVYLAPKNTKDA